MGGAWEAHGARREAGRESGQGKRRGGGERAGESGKGAAEGGPRATTRIACAVALLLTRIPPSLPASK